MRYVLTGILSAVAGALLWREYAPPRTVTVLGPERVVIRDTKRTRTVSKPDGTRVVTITERAERENSKPVVVAPRAATPKWFAGPILIVQPRLAPLGADLYAGALVSRQLLGPVSVGLTATVPVRQPLTVPTVGVSLGVAW